MTTRRWLLFAVGVLIVLALVYWLAPDSAYEGRTFLRELLRALSRAL